MHHSDQSQVYMDRRRRSRVILYFVIVMTIIGIFGHGLMKRIRSTSYAKSLMADSRFIFSAADDYFRHNPDAETLTLFELIAWSHEKYGERNWTSTLDPHATYDCTFGKNEWKIVMTHPLVDGEVVRMY